VGKHGRYHFLDLSFFVVQKICMTPRHSPKRSWEDNIKLVINYAR
jgi:hypothetical protein